jgi:hypothetical protein
MHNAYIRCLGDKIATGINSEIDHESAVLRDLYRLHFHFIYLIDVFISVSYGCSINCEDFVLGVPPFCPFEVMPGILLIQM